jgi:hypothetical protein
MTPAEIAARLTAREARTMGVNWNLAPVCDLDLLPENPFLGTRAFGRDARTVAQLASFGQAVSARERRTGDLVIFGSGRPTHAGIYVGGGRFVHAPSTGGTVRLDRLDNRHWASQPTAFRRP